MSEQSLKQKTVKGVGWSAVDNVTKMGITFIVSIVLARLLSPDEYGLIGILTIFISIFNAIVDSGFTAALIRKKDATDTDYSTVFYVNLLMSILMAVALYLCARPIAIFFEREELVALTRVMSCVVVINAFSIVQKAITTKRIDFKTQTKITFFSSLLSGIVGIAMAYGGYGVWALVGQQISLQLLTTILFWIYNRWIPRFVFSIESFQEMWAFGWKLLLSGLLNTGYKETYQTIIGKCYSPATLGLYTRAKQFCDLCSTNLTTVVQRVSFPVLSTIQDDKVKLKEAYRHIIKTTMLVTFVLMLGLAACAKSLILVLIGEKWIECVPLLQIASTYGMLFPLHAINLNMLQVQGRSDLFLKLEILKIIVGILPLLAGVFIGIYAMLWFCLLSNIIGCYLNAYYSGPFLKYSFVDQIKDILPALGIALAMAFCVYIVNYFSLNPYATLAIQITVGAIVTLVLCEITKLPEYVEIKNIVRPLLNKIINK